jgi:hypothetical protein
VLKTLVALLQPLADTTRHVEGERYPTLSLATLAILNMPAKLKDGRIAPQHTLLLEALVAAWSGRFAELPPVARYAVVLDPRTCHLARNVVEAGGAAADDARAEASGLRLAGKLKWAQWLRDVAAAVSRLNPEIAAAQTAKEVEQYVAACAMVPNTYNPLKWWRNNEELLPALASLARRVLAVPATSAAAERVFSTAGNTVTTKRVRLAADTVESLVFLRHAFKTERVKRDAAAAGDEMDEVEWVRSAIAYTEHDGVLIEFALDNA